MSGAHFFTYEGDEGAPFLNERIYCQLLSMRGGFTMYDCILLLATSVSEKK